MVGGVCYVLERPHDRGLEGPGEEVSEALFSLIGAVEKGVERGPPCEERRRTCIANRSGA